MIRSFLRCCCSIRFCQEFRSTRSIRSTRGFRHRIPCLNPGSCRERHWKRLSIRSNRSFRPSRSCFSILNASHSRCSPIRSFHSIHSSFRMSLMNSDHSCSGRSPYVLPPCSGALITQTHLCGAMPPLRRKKATFTPFVFFVHRISRHDSCNNVRYRTYMGFNTSRAFYLPRSQSPGSPEGA